VNLILGQPQRVFTCFTNHVFKFEGNCPKFFPFLFLFTYQKKKTIFGSGNLVWILRNSYNFISCMVDVKQVSVVLY
jgi:hypothetical protein